MLIHAVQIDGAMRYFVNQGDALAAGKAEAEPMPVDEFVQVRAVVLQQVTRAKLVELLNDLEGFAAKVEAAPVIKGFRGKCSPTSDD